MHDYNASNDENTRIFNRIVIPDISPDRKNHKSVKKLNKRINDTLKSLTSLRSFRIDRPITPTNIRPMTESFKDIKDLISYSFRGLKTKFYFNIMLTQNQRTAQLKEHHFAYIYENEFEISPEKLSPIRQLEFPTKNEINIKKRKALMRQFDDSHSDRR